MSTIYGKYGPAHPWLGNLAFAAARPLCRFRYARKHVHEVDSPFAASAWNRCVRGWPAGRRAISPAWGSRVITAAPRSSKSPPATACGSWRMTKKSFTGVKHFGGYPAQSIESLKQRLARMDLEPRDLHAVLLSWNYVSLSSLGIKSVAEHFPRSLALAQRCDRRLRFLPDRRIRPQGGGTARKTIRTRRVAAADLDGAPRKPRRLFLRRFPLQPERQASDDHRPGRIW